MKSRRAKPAWQRRIAKERIQILFTQAAAQAKKNPERSHRYVFLARKLAMKYNLRLPKQLRRKFCHHCYHYFMPGVNCRVRTNRRTQSTEYRCLDCGRITRWPYVREKRAKQTQMRQ